MDHHERDASSLEFFKSETAPFLFFHSEFFLRIALARLSILYREIDFSPTVWLIK